MSAAASRPTRRAAYPWISAKYRSKTAPNCSGSARAGSASRMVVTSLACPMWPRAFPIYVFRRKPPRNRSVPGIVARVDVVEADRPERRDLGDVLAGLRPVEVRRLARQHDDGAGRIRLQLVRVEVLAQPDVENTGDDRVDPVLVVSVRHQLHPGGCLDPDGVRTGLARMTHHDGELSRRRERRERLEVDLLRQDRPEDVLARLVLGGGHRRRNLLTR